MSSHPLGACSNRHGCRRARLNAGDALHFDVAARDAVAVAVGITLERLDGAVLVLLAAAAIGRDSTRGGISLVGGDLDGLGLRWRGPPRNFPLDAGEGLELEAALGPLPTWLAGAIEGTQASIDGALVRLGSESVCSRSGLEGTVVPVAVLALCKWDSSGQGVVTHIRCLFLGPGFPRILANPSPFAAAADRLTPFFLGP